MFSLMSPAGAPPFVPGMGSASLMCDSVGSNGSNALLSSEALPQPAHNEAQMAATIARVNVPIRGVDGMTCSFLSAP
jgi:hypothetical protein